MELFNEQADPAINLLPYEGIVNYYGPVMSMQDAQHYFDALLKAIEWRNDEAVIFGRHLITKRKAAWYGDADYSYTYSKVTKHALPWTPELAELKALVERTTGEIFNSCLLNLYHTGEEGMAWHSDDELMLEKNGAIASLSLGAARKFSFRHKKTKQTVSLVLDPGSLLVMKGSTQTHWHHRLPPTKRVHEPRINLTFRKMV
ncbi:MAG: alpha-ketoglutarate-dependent dioxygenase AlkB [Chitinophagaceae bacterium]|nr:alpha-ketoglutarate-dependent dioxygenase AlkB [Chitinophagaceae bacterium]